MRKLKVVLGSNKELWWEGLSLLIQKSPQIELVKTCYSADETVDVVLKNDPDILLLDIDIEGGCEKVLKRLNEKKARTKTALIIKPYKDLDYTHIWKFSALPNAYLDKNITFPELMDCLTKINRGKRNIIYSLSAQKYIKDLDYVEQGSIKLTRREKELLFLIGTRGSSNKELAETFNITENTVKAHLKRIYDKLSVSNRQQAIIKAQKIGIL